MYLDTKHQRYRIQVDRRVAGRRHRVSRLLPRGTTETEARAIEDRMTREALNQAGLAGSSDAWTTHVQQLEAERGGWVDKALAKCDYRTKKRNGRCTITRAAIVALLHASCGRCAVTGLPFSDAVAPGTRARPFMHSIDRVRSDGEYTADNIRLVCAGVNVAMMHWGEAVFAEFATGYVLRKYGILFNAAEGR